MHFPAAFTNPTFLIFLAVRSFIEARALAAASRETPPGWQSQYSARPGTPVFFVYVALVIFVQFLYFLFLDNTRDFMRVFGYGQLLHSVIFFSVRFYFCRTVLRMPSASSIGVVVAMLAANIACNTLSLFARIAVRASAFSHGAIYVNSATRYVLNIVPDIVNFLLYAAALEIILVRYWPRRNAVGKALLPAALGFCLLAAFYVREGLNPHIGELFEWARSAPEGLFDLENLLEIFPPALLLAIPLAYFSYAALLLCLAIKTNSVIASERTTPGRAPTPQPTGGGKPGLPAPSATPAKQPSGYNRPERTSGNSYHTSGFREKEARMRKKRRYAAIALTALAAVLVLLSTIEVVRERTGNSYDKIAVIGIISIVLLAVIIFAVVYSTNNPTSRQTVEKIEDRKTPAVDRAFMEKTKGLRRQRFACRLLAVLFFIPSLFFIVKRDKEFRKAEEERDIEAMRAAVGGMWPPAVIGLLLGLAILWARILAD